MAVALTGVVALKGSAASCHAFLEDTFAEIQSTPIDEAMEPNPLQLGTLMGMGSDGAWDNAEVFTRIPVHASLTDATIKYPMPTGTSRTSSGAGSFFTSPITGTVFAHTFAVTEGYTFWWRINEAALTISLLFIVRPPVRWFGWGIGELGSGLMPGADTLVCWRGLDGEWLVEDGFADDASRPVNHTLNIAPAFSKWRQRESRIK